MEILKVVKWLPEDETMRGIYVIYDLSDISSNPTNKKYLINKKYSDYAFRYLTPKEIIKTAIKESEYVYGIGFFDTVKECELYYDCCRLELKLKSVTNKIKQINPLSEKESIVFHHE